MTSPPRRSAWAQSSASCGRLLAERLQGIGEAAKGVEPLLGDAFQASSKGDCWIVGSVEPTEVAVAIMTSRPRLIDALARGRALFILDVAAIRRAQPK
jgi:hypothetical protein